VNLDVCHNDTHATLGNQIPDPMRPSWLSTGLVILMVLVSVFAELTTRGLSLQEYLSQGDNLLASNQFQAAIAVYRDAATQVELWLATNNSANNDRNEEDWLQSSLSNVVSLFSNMGTALSAVEGESQSIQVYQHALKMFQMFIDDIADPSYRQEVTRIAAQTAFYLGMDFQDLGNATEAITAYRYAIQLDPFHWSAFANLGGVYHDSLANCAYAIRSYQQAFSLLTNANVTDLTDPPVEPEPILSQLQYRIGLCIAHDLDEDENHNPNLVHDSIQHRQCALPHDPTHFVSCREMATNAFSLAVQYDSTNEAAAHMLASITADATILRASNQYIKSLFDNYASNFEHSLVDELQYTGYMRLRMAFDRALGVHHNDSAIASDKHIVHDYKNVSFDLVVDAGCGTGLTGEQFRNISKILIGVDLSGTIIQQAQQKRPNLYDSVQVEDVAEFVRQQSGQVNLVIAGDSFIYFGDLDPLFDALSTGLAIDGYLAFTLENADASTEKILAETKANWRWQLTASGRFAHRHEYVIEVANRYHLSLVHYEPLLNFRYEKGVGVRGHIFVLQKRTTKGMEQEL
jgi:predicted TPR repeat methyltransferase